MSVTWLPYFILLGALTGLLSGLFGIGGGLIIVPGLYFLYTHMHGAGPWMYYAVGSSLLIMVFTTASSAWAHGRAGNIERRFYPPLAAGVLVGTPLGSWAGGHLDGRVLRGLFAGMLLVAVVQMVRPGRAAGAAGVRPPPRGWITLAGGGIGLLSGLLGVGGGVFTVSFLTWRGADIRKAVGTSAALTLPIACLGAGSFLLWNHAAVLRPEWFRLVCWPGLLVTAVLATICAPLGARLAVRLPRPLLRMLFACLALALCVKLLLSSH